MKRRTFVAVVSVFSCAFVAGCADEPPVKHDKVCKSVGGIKMCDTTINGEDCTIIDPGRSDQEIRCDRDNELSCSVEQDNTSGNICKLKVGTHWCVAVLPDGSKAPKYKPDYIDCPEQEPVSGKR